jgi:CDP-diacylglycerol--serine O-phosphatidyltransferase
MESHIESATGERHLKVTANPWAPARYIHHCNLLTYVSLICGVAAVIAAQELRSWEITGLLIALAALADTFDGKFARRFPRTNDEQAFGEQLDSLADAVSFGVVPVLCLHSLVPVASVSARLLLFSVSSIYVICALTRLGYYNVHHHVQRGFVGLPTTLAALLCSTLFLAHPGLLAAVLALTGIALAMISFLPIPRPRGIAWWAYMFWFSAVFAACGMQIGRHH